MEAVLSEERRRSEADAEALRRDLSRGREELLHSGSALAEAEDGRRAAHSDLARKDLELGRLHGELAQLHDERRRGGADAAAGRGEAREAENEALLQQLRQENFRLTEALTAAEAVATTPSFAASPLMTSSADEAATTASGLMDASAGTKQRRTLPTPGFAVRRRSSSASALTRPSTGGAGAGGATGAPSSSELRQARAEAQRHRELLEEAQAEVEWLRQQVEEQAAQLSKADPSVAHDQAMKIWNLQAELTHAQQELRNEIGEVARLRAELAGGELTSREELCDAGVLSDDDFDSWPLAGGLP